MRTTMALRAAAVTGRPTNSTPSTSTTKTHQLKTPTLLPPASTAAVSLLTLVCTPSGQAKAFTFPKEDILSSLSKVEETLDQVEKVSSNVLDYSLSAFKVLFDALKPTLDVATPVVQKASEEALKAASPIVSEATKQAQGALQDAGVDPSPVLKTVVDAAQQGTKVLEGAKPIASATFETLSSNDPSVLLGSAGALFLAYLLLPTVWSAISFNFRGYKGNLSPALALDLVSSQNYVIVDIRSEKDKNKAGVHDSEACLSTEIEEITPQTILRIRDLRGKSYEDGKITGHIEPLEEVPSKIKGLVRDVKKVEAEIAALKISYLKRVGKSSNIIILDSYADSAKIVAKVLTYLGFKNVWVVSDGFSGGKGWVQSRLSSDSYNTTFAEILSPSRVIPAVSRFGTTGSRATQKLLPGNIDV